MPARNAAGNPTGISSRPHDEPKRCRANLGKIGEIQAAPKVQPALSAFQLDEKADRLNAAGFRLALKRRRERYYSDSVGVSGMVISWPPAVPVPPNPPIV